MKIRARYSSPDRVPTGAVAKKLGRNYIGIEKEREYIAFAKERIAAIKTKAELLAYCKECWDASTEAVGQLTDEKLAATVETPWGFSFPGSACLGIVLDESLHHRGQFYAYLRVLGQKPPNMWDFAGNAPEYQPKAHAAKA